MAEGYWLSDNGIKLRFELLSQFVVTNSYNRAIQMHGKAMGIKKFLYLRGSDYECDECDGFEGHVYNAGQFMPYLPRHPFCVCFWDVLIESLFRPVA